MSLRIRLDGTVLCAAMHPALPGDVYVHDDVSYELTVNHGLLITDYRHLRKAGNDTEGPLDGHGQWWWRDDPYGRNHGPDRG